MATIKKKKNPETIRVNEDIGKLELLCTVDGDVKWYGHFEKQYGCSSKIKNRTAI